jgi:hypothetical protein
VQRSALSVLETIVDSTGLANHLEELLPIGVRERQLKVRTLLLGILLALRDGRPAHLTRVHQALVALENQERRRLGVTVDWKCGPHLLSYRQVERTFSLVVAVMTSHTAISDNLLQRFSDELLEASIPAEYKDATDAYAADWTDVESFARPPLTEGGHTADPDATWGHRRGDSPGQEHELFFGFYLQLATMVHEENSDAVPEFVRRLLLANCHTDPPRAFVPVLEGMVQTGVGLGDVLCDSGYSHRIPEHWALPLRALRANLVMDLHPHDRGTQGTHQGAICFNGSVYCPATPDALLDIGPLPRSASAEETDIHDRKSAELALYKLGRITSDDEDGFHRVSCPAVSGKVRCPKRAASMALSRERPEILAPPTDAPPCCRQATITVPPDVNAKTRQKHDYPSKAHRLSYGRRSAAERSNSTVKDPASNDISRGWCRLMGLGPMTVMLTCLFVVRNQRVLASFEARQAEDQRRAATGQPPKTRKRRRRTIADLVTASQNAPPH